MRRLGLPLAALAAAGLPALLALGCGGARTAPIATADPLGAPAKPVTPVTPASASASASSSASAGATGSTSRDSEARRAAVAEAVLLLERLGKGMRAAYQQEIDTSGKGKGPFVHRFCASARTAVPAEIPRARVPLAGDAWSDAGWTCLGFSTTAPVRCQYAYLSNGATGSAAHATATARCDPDGDGALVVATLAMDGSGDGEPSEASTEIVGGGATYDEQRAANRRSGTGVVAACERYAARVCACKDNACAKRENERFAKEAETFKDAKGSDDDVRRVEEAMKRATECVMTLANKQP